MNIDQAIEKLHNQLPLRARQEALPPELAEVHRTILRSFIEQGRPPKSTELAASVPGGDVAGALKRLGDDDLVVLNREGKEAVGAYPMTMADTPHRIRVAGHNFHAMCALDALSIAPMYDVEVHIDSRCHVTGKPVHIIQQGMNIVEATPDREIRVGIHWQNPCGAAAHSMCLEMIFLRDAETAARWQGGDTENLTVFTLDEAVAFGAGFFKPLVQA
ncbi:alkylmercury lyase family protein [Thioalkalivibrio thiocyanodenitrificans]|uniref:alkylmercury lyase family protein n=1 Tax=Thioalkalivibrio thiocyanodenitrificans TaxID=243063 RepID=UPI0003698058|nr:alkylmercury lyase family protein [Thioalkalivibrio thiocyanodenitrificans]